MPRGGKREGAGRKPREIPREAITIRLEPEVAKIFKKICNRNKSSYSQQVTEWTHQEALKLSPFSYSYPDVENDGPIDHEAIPVGGPYPKHTKLPTIYRYTNKSIGCQNAKVEMDYGKDDTPYPFWLKYR